MIKKLQAFAKGYRMQFRYLLDFVMLLPGCVCPWFSFGVCEVGEL